MRTQIALAFAVTTAAMSFSAAAQYRPLVDSAVIQDWAKYERDLRDCQGYATQASPGRNAVAGAVAGAIIGAAIGVAIGNNSSYAAAGARGGAIGGAMRGAGDGAAMQVTIIRNCMMGRGYQLLDAPTVAVAYPQQQPPAGVPANHCHLTPGAEGCQQVAPESGAASNAVAADGEAIAATAAPPPGPPPSPQACRIAPGLAGCDVATQPPPEEAK